MNIIKESVSELTRVVVKKNISDIVIEHPLNNNYNTVYPPIIFGNTLISLNEIKVIN